jgi:arsenate reductase
MRTMLWSVCCLFLIASPFTLLAQPRPPRAPNDSQMVVFVCEHGTVKSVVAMAYFAKLAKERHLPLRAISRGTKPDPSVPSLVLDGLRADGVALGPFTPTRFSSSDLPSAIVVISFDQPSVASIVAGRLPTAAWDGMPAVSDNYVLAREAIRHRVADLVDSLAKQSAGRAKTPRP